jgi:hypothetical protein
MLSLSSCEEAMMDVKKPITTGIITSAPLTRQPTRIAPQQLDDLTIRWLRQMRQPVPTAQVAPLPMEAQVESEPLARQPQRPQPPQQRWFTAQNSPAKPSVAPTPLPARRRKKGSPQWAQWSGLLPQAMRRMRQALWRETQRMGRLTMARWRQQQHRRREGRRRG